MTPRPAPGGPRGVGRVHFVGPLRGAGKMTALERADVTVEPEAARALDGGHAQHVLGIAHRDVLEYRARDDDGRDHRDANRTHGDRQ